MADSSLNTPDVLVLGMPSSGKTVFLSVLGRNFTLVADDSDARPLGFRMRAIGRSTQETVSRNYARLLGGEWPASTIAGSVTPLTWDVFTGMRKVFTLSSMDVSGESFVKAFCEGGSDAIRQREQGEKDGLLDMTRSESGADGAVEMLRELALSAKVICFFVNIAAARRGRIRGEGGANAGQVDIDSVRNYEEGIANICVLFDELPSLRSKALVVLTQAHRHQSEIEKAGGPAAFLGRIAPSLRQSVAEFNIPVIAVSAINERDSEGGFDDDEDENAVPETIESDGLFGFLLVVAGMIPDARLAHVKDCYLQYLADKARYLQLMCRTILERLPLVKAYSRSGLAFEKSCREYLDEASNVNSDDGESLSRSAIDLYRRRTMSDKDIDSAGSAWKRRLAIDMAWDHVFRRIVLDEAKRVADDASQDSAASPLSAQGIVETVRGEIERGSACRGGLTQAALYGFERDELDPVRDAADEGAWVLKCLEEYRLRIASDLDDCMQLFVEAKQMIAEVDPRQGVDFNIKKESVVEAISKCRELLATFRDEWYVGEVGGLPQLDALGEALETLAESVGNLERRHSKWLDEVEAARQRQAVAQAHARQLAYEKTMAQEQSFRRKRMFAIAIGSALIALGFVALFFSGRNTRIRDNTRHANEATQAYNAKDYEYAKQQLGLLRESPVFFVSRRDFVSEEFVKKVDAAIERQVREEEAKRQEEISALKAECRKAREAAEQKVSGRFALSAFKKVDARRESAEKSYSGDEIDFARYLDELKECRDLYWKTADKAEKERQVAAAKGAYENARREAEASQAEDFAFSDFYKAKIKRSEAEGSYANGTIDADRYIAMLGEAGQLCEAARKTAETARLSKAEGECKKARDSAVAVGAKIHASGEFEEAVRKQDEAAQSHSTGAIGVGKYVEILGEVEQLYKDARKKVEDEQVSEARRVCDKARADAEKSEAWEFAFNELTAANSKRQEADKAYSCGSIDFGKYVQNLKSLAELYGGVKRTAIANAKPRVNIHTTINGREVKGVPKTITSGLEKYTTKVENVDLGAFELGSKLEFEANGKVDGIYYTGKANYTIWKGKGDCYIPLYPKYTVNVNFCPNCGRKVVNKHDNRCSQCYLELPCD